MNTGSKWFIFSLTFFLCPRIFQERAEKGFVSLFQPFSAFFSLFQPFSAFFSLFQPFQPLKSKSMI
jgi:hypothetical protein